MNQIQTWLSKRRQQREAQRESFARTVARRLWEERTGGDAPQPDPEEAERQAALKDWHTAEWLAANPIRRGAWWGSEQLRAFRRSQSPAVRFVRFFVWDSPRWVITSIQLFLGSDVVKLLAVPVLGAAIATATTFQERHESEQVKTFDEYLNQIDTLTFEHGLLGEDRKPGALIIARGRTIAALRKLDTQRRQELIAFIQASGFHQGENPVISFAGANFQGLKFGKADLRDFNFKGANLRNADLSEADLENADLSETDLSRADLSEANLRNADLSEAELNEADLSEADLENADLSGAMLWGADLSGAMLWGTNLSGAELWSTNLSRAILRDTNLSGAGLNGANLNGAYLQGADLRKANLDIANLDGVYYCETTMPDGAVRNDNCYEQWSGPQGLVFMEFWKESEE